MTKKSKKKIWIGVVALALVLLAAFLVLGRKKAAQAVQFETARIETASISTSITATGTVEAVTTVDVGTQVSGRVTKIYVDYNSVVRKGQVIAELDRTTLESELASQEANLRSAQESLRKAKESTLPAASEATLRSAKVDLEYQKKNYNRYAELYQKGLIAAAEYDVAKQSYEKAQAAVRQAELGVTGDQYSVKQAEESVRMAQQSVQKARTNLSYATIYSPIDGVVISKDVEEGQTVASSFSTPTLFTIAKDLSDMQVIANVDEADIGNVREGQRVTFTVDAFPDDTFTGQVKQVRQKATTTNNVVTYEVVISAPNADLKLKPGLTANITIYTLERPDVMSVPSKALRFTPEPSVVGKKYKIRDINAPHKLWTLENNIFIAHAVEIGTTDGTRTEITSGLEPNTEVVVDIKAAPMGGGFPGGPPQMDGQQQGNSGNTESSPFAPKPPGKKK